MPPAGGRSITALFRLFVAVGWMGVGAGASGCATRSAQAVLVFFFFFSLCVALFFFFSSILAAACRFLCGGRSARLWVQGGDGATRASRAARQPARRGPPRVGPHHTGGGVGPHRRWTSDAWPWTDAVLDRGASRRPTAPRIHGHRRLSDLPPTSAPARAASRQAWRVASARVTPHPFETRTKKGAPHRSFARVRGESGVSASELLQYKHAAAMVAMTAACTRRRSRADSITTAHSKYATLHTNPSRARRGVQPPSSRPQRHASCAAHEQPPH